MKRGLCNILRKAVSHLHKDTAELFTIRHIELTAEAMQIGKRLLREGIRKKLCSLKYTPNTAEAVSPTSLKPKRI